MTDPYRTLGIAPDAGDEAIRAAYLAAIRACPPERDPARFERVRAAFDAIGSARARLAHQVLDTTAPDLEDVLAAAIGTAPPTRRVDAARLLRVLAGK